MAKSSPLAAQDKHRLAQERVARGDWVVDAEAGVIRNSAGHPLGWLTSHGYVFVGLSDRGRKRSVYAHRVIWESVHGPLPAEYVAAQINHINNDRADNRLANLEVVSAQGNAQHAHRQGRNADNNGEAAPWAKLTAERVADIRRRYAAGEWQKHLAAEYGLSRGYLSLIVRGRRWSTTADSIPQDGRTRASGRR